MRLFWALPVPEGLKTGITRLQALGREAGLRAVWPDPAGAHLTLSFLGEVAESEVQMLLGVGERVAREHPSLDLLTGGLGAFPSAGRARVWWLGLASCPELEVLQAALAGACEIEAGPFQPHVTLARMKGPTDVSALGPAPAPMAWPVRELVLLRSLLGPGGAQYASLGAARLANQGPPQLRH